MCTDFVKQSAEPIKPRTMSKPLFFGTWAFVLGAGFILPCLIGCVSSSKSGPKALGQSLDSKRSGGVGSPTDSQSAINLIKERQAASEKTDWFAWTKPIGQGWSKLTNPLMARRSDPSKPHDQLSLDVEVDPNGDLFAGAAEYAMSMGNFQQARALYEKALEQEEERDDIRMGLARAAVMQGDFDAAQTTYTELLADNPNVAALHNDIAMMYDRMDEPQRCYYHFDQAIRLAPDSKRYRNNLAARMVKDGRVQQAQQMLREKVDGPTADLTISALLGQQGQTRLAADYWQSARREAHLLPFDHPLHSYFAESSATERVADRPRERLAPPTNGPQMY